MNIDHVAPPGAVVRRSVGRQRTVCPTPDPGVFSVNSPASGVAGSACAGITFTVSAPDASGVVTFTPSSPVGLRASGGFCEVSFTFSVVKRPTIDVDVATAGSQTRTNFHATVQSSGGGMPSVGRPTRS